MQKADKTEKNSLNDSIYFMYNILPYNMDTAMLK